MLKSMLQLYSQQPNMKLFTNSTIDYLYSQYMMSCMQKASEVSLIDIICSGGTVPQYVTLSAGPIVVVLIIN